MSQVSPRVWLITGASRGFGLCIARAALSQGDVVVATARRPAGLEAVLGAQARLLVLPLDVTDEASIASAIQAAEDRCGRIDVLVNNAGYGLFGPLEAVTPAELEAQFRTNVFGVHAVTRAVLPGMRARRSGHVVNISSVSGIICGPGRGAYGGSKFALEAFSEAWALELAPLGIRVTIVEPGQFRTDFLADSKRLAGADIPDYAATTAQLQQSVSDNNGKQTGDPEKAAAAILAAVSAAEPPLRLALGEDAYTYIGVKLDNVRRGLEAWKDVTLNTKFEA